MTIQNNTITIGAKTFSFTRDITHVVEIRDLVVLRLKCIDADDCLNNVYAIRGDRILWQVQDPIHYNPAFATLEAHLGGYADLEIYNKDPNLLIVTNFRGGTFLVNPENGAIVGQGPWVK